MSKPTRLSSLSDLYQIIPGGKPPENTSGKETDRASTELKLKLHASIEKKGRGGKTVTVISGFHHVREDLENLARQMKTLCGTGGTVREDRIELQGDHREKAVEFLRKKGFQIK